MPAVSILIPAYNAERWVAQAIESALAQGPEMEVIVVDDGSTDGTRTRVAAFGNRIRAERGPNRGAPHARNRLLALAVAPWIQYLDADDYLLPGKVSGQLAALNAHPDADVLYGPETTEWWGETVERITTLPIPEPHDPWRQLALWRLPQTGAPLWRREALEHVGGWRRDQPCCQEHELYLRLLIAGKKFIHHPAGGAVYRRFRSGTVSTSNMPQVRAERAKILVRLAEHLQRRGQLTTDRQWAIDQAYFEMARASWTEDRREARRYFESISSVDFEASGPAAPEAYKRASKVVGFEGAELLAMVKRGVVSAWWKQSGKQNSRK